MTEAWEFGKPLGQSVSFHPPGTNNAGSQIVIDTGRLELPLTFRCLHYYRRLLVIRPIPALPFLRHRKPSIVSTNDNGHCVPCLRLRQDMQYFSELCFCPEGRLNGKKPRRFSPCGAFMISLISIEKISWKLFTLILRCACLATTYSPVP